MFVTVKINDSALPVGTLVCHDSGNIWRQATSSDVAPLGVLSEVLTDDEGVHWGRVILAGATYARAGSAIPDHGGWLAVDDQGRAIVGPAEDCGLIAPLSRGATAPSIDDLILVFIR
jgi:hypothetical protein